MTIRILCIGKLKERFLCGCRFGICETPSRYASVEIVELADERAPEQLSPAQREQVKDAEGKRMLARVGEGEFLVALDQRGAELSSEQLSAHMQGWISAGKSRIAFAIGGFTRPFRSRCLPRGFPAFPLGSQRFSHQIFRIMLLEQIYRAFKIMNGEPYHK